MPTPRTKASIEAMRAFARRLQYLVYRKQFAQLDPVTQEDIALGVSKLLGLKVPLRTASISRWLLGQSMPDVLVLRAVARWFEVDPGWLTFGPDSAAPAPFAGEIALADASAPAVGPRRARKRA